MEPVTLDHRPPAAARPGHRATSTRCIAACQDPEIQRWTTVPSPYRREHARVLRRPVVTEGWRTDTAYTFGVLPARRRPCSMGCVASTAPPGRHLGDRLLDGEGAPRQRLHRRGGPSPLARWAFDRAGRRSGWSGSPRPATRAPGRSPRSRLRDRGHAPAAASTRDTRRDAWTARCSRPTWASAVRGALPPGRDGASRVPAARPARRTACRPAPPADCRTQPPRVPRIGGSADETGLSVARVLRLCGHDERLPPPPAVDCPPTRPAGSRCAPRASSAPPTGGAGVRGVLRPLGAVQLDTISVLARSHELSRTPGWAPSAATRSRRRTGPRPRTDAARLRVLVARRLHPAHRGVAALRLPPPRLPRPPALDHDLSGRRPTTRSSSSCATEGPLTATELGGAKNGGRWWDWSDAEDRRGVALMDGEVVCTRAPRLEAGLRPGGAGRPGRTCCTTTWTTPSACAGWSRLAGRRSGVGTRADLADYHRLKGEQVDAVIADSGLVPVRSRAGPSRPGPIPAALAHRPRGRHRTTLLSPFDSLIWDRARTERIFGFTHRLEAYVPEAQADPRLLRHAAAGRRPAGRPGRPGARGQHAGRPAGLAGRPEGGAGRWPRPCARRPSGSAATDVRVERVDARELRAPGAPGSSSAAWLTGPGRGAGQRISRIFSRIA